MPERTILTDAENFQVVAKLAANINRRIERGKSYFNFAFVFLVLVSRSSPRAAT
jgi:hypothetical protein